MAGFRNQLISKSSPHVRRVFEFVDLPSEEIEEGPRGTRTGTISKPQNGDIRFANYTMSYRRDTPIILSNLYLTLPAGSKTALIGRTGSGKTSLMQALMRMVYVREGDIRIGNRSIYEMDVRELRKLFGVVPQISVSFCRDHSLQSGSSWNDFHRSPREIHEVRRAIFSPGPRGD